MNERPFVLVISGPDRALILRDLFSHELSIAELQAVLIALSSVPTMFLDEEKRLSFHESLLQLEALVK